MEKDAQQNIVGVIEKRLETALDAKAERIEEAKTFQDGLKTGWFLTFFSLLREQRQR